MRMTNTLEAPVATPSNMVRRVSERTSRTINGHIGFGDGTNTDNIDGSWVTVTTPGSPNTNFTVNHGLNRIPVGYLVMSKNAAVDIYTGSIVATKTQITLRATVAGVAVKLFIF